VLKGLSLACEYRSYGFTTSATSAAWIPSSQPSICATLWTLAVEPPPLVVAAHIISSSAGHGDLRSFSARRSDRPEAGVPAGSDSAFDVSEDNGGGSLGPKQAEAGDLAKRWPLDRPWMRPPERRNVAVRRWTDRLVKHDLVGQEKLPPVGRSAPCRP
jgi:hypothetical protein